VLIIRKNVKIKTEWREPVAKQIVNIMGQSSYSLKGNGTDLSKINPPDGTNMGSSGSTINAHYMHVIPNSHFWTDLNQIIASIGYQLQRMQDEVKENSNVVYCSEPLTKEYLLIGLNNSIKNGYKIKRFAEPHGGFSSPVFASVDAIIKYVADTLFMARPDFIGLSMMLQNTIDNGLNLTNGLKMERKEIYKRLDGERDYQDARWGTRRTLEGTPDEEKPVAEWINYMEYHLSKAKERVYHLDTEGALAEVRKVSALGVRAMEIHGCPIRQIEAGDGTKPTELDTTCCDGECKK
jgi:hypothetical protein